MTRRDLIALPACAAVAELTGPLTPEARLREATLRWIKAEQTVTDTLRVLQSSREAILSALTEGAGERQLARLVEARKTAREEWQSAVRAAAEAEQRMEASTRWVREG